MRRIITQAGSRASVWGSHRRVFTVDFEHRFEPGAPLYMGISRDECKLHLSEHHGDSTPGAAIRIPVDELEAYHQQLLAKRYRFGRPGLQDQEWVRARWSCWVVSETSLSSIEISTIGSLDNIRTIARFVTDCGHGNDLDGGSAHLELWAQLGARRHDHHLRERRRASTARVRIHAGLLGKATPTRGRSRQIWTRAVWW